MTARDEDIHSRLDRAERRVRLLSAGFALALAGIAVGFTTQGAAGRPEVLTANGLVIVDDAGRPRVVIGAPGAAASEDPRLAATTGMIVLDSLNQLSVAVGTDAPLVLDDGSVGERIASSAGLTFYDPRDGKERGGIGAFADGRAVACLDYAGGQKEAACMVVAPDDQYSAVLLNGTPQESDYDRVGMFLGADGVGVLKAFGGGEHRDGVLIKAGGGLPEIMVFDSTQTQIDDLIER
jgi:hypothetical protein